MNKSLKWILIIVGVLAVLFVGAKMLGGSSKTGTKVTAEKAQKRTIVETVNASGKVYPEVEVKISPDISGEITELDVQEGDSVKKGQVLARIYADIYSSQRDEAAARVMQSQATVANSEANLTALKAQLDQAKTTYDRNKDLYDQKVISKAEFEQYETQYRTAQSQYNAAQQNIRSLKAATQSTQTSLVAANKNLSRTTLVSPMNGVISSLSVKKGERVSGNSFTLGTEMMRVAEMDVMEVRVDVGENDIVKVSIGDSADIEVEAYNNRKFKGVVTQIASSTKTTQTSSGDVTNYEVRIRIDASSYRDLADPSKPKKFPFRPGMNASADIKTKKKDNVVSVPIASVAARVKGSDKSVADEKKEKEKSKDDNTDVNISGDALEEVVFVIKKDGTVEKRTVTTGIQDMNYIEITSGLKEGEEIVTAPFDAVNKTMKSGDKIIIVPKDKLFQK
ncbi:MAG TPA: efflux RND transporter periplasmic adaptor subunit [Flavisolibacter sp.]|jgi:HlyD family secretion protein|nr:efflux RND transporter periplasmic adaptor subunit [Flavisolibacter sp.]